jgi:radical SAM protein with 4Fe4S-binding SPASM domain
MTNSDNFERRRLDPTAVNLVAVYDKVLQIIQGEIPLPEVVELFLTNYCSFACPFCRCAKYHGDRSEYMEFGVLSNLLDELSQKGVKTIEMGGGGEPLEHPKIKEIITRLAKDGFRLGLITNGYVLTEKRELMDLLLQCADWVRFSVDSVTNDVYPLVHGRHDLSYSALKEIMAEMVRGVNAKPQMDQRPRIGMKLIVQQPNESQILQAVDEALEIGVHYLQFKWLEEHPWSIPMERRGELVDNLEKKIAEVAQERLTIDLLLGYGGPRMQGRCMMSVLHPLIDWDGNIYMCAFFHHRKQSHSIGNITQSQFFQCWDAKHHREQMKGIDSNQCAPNCPLLRYNPVIEFIKEEHFRFHYI